MKKLLSVLCILLLFSCTSKPKGSTMVLIETSYGDIKVMLYDDTPLHKANFLKLVRSGYYNDLLFHRVIPHFMIQGGDPDSRTSKPGQMLGNGDTGYTLPAEIRSNHFHKRGALAAAREGDDINPEQRSSGGQFYIVQGKLFTEGEIKQQEANMNEKRYQLKVSQVFTKERDSLLKAGAEANYDTLIHCTMAAVSKSYKPFHFTDEEIKYYTTEGGVPHLDGAYTVFGEVVSGMDVVDKIAAEATDRNDRPLKDIRMKMKIIE